MHGLLNVKYLTHFTGMLTIILSKMLFVTVLVILRNGLLLKVIHVQVLIKNSHNETTNVLMFMYIYIYIYIYITHNMSEFQRISIYLYHCQGVT